MRKGFTFIELMIVISIISIIATVAMPIYLDYSKKARTSEVPINLKKIVEAQLAYRADPDHPSFAGNINDLNWVTSLGTADGQFYRFGTTGVAVCSDDRSAGLGTAVAQNNFLTDVPAKWVSVCMGTDTKIKPLP